MSDQGLIVGGLGSGHREFRFGVCGPGRFDDVLSRAAASAAFSASMSSGKASPPESMTR